MVNTEGWTASTQDRPSPGNYAIMARKRASFSARLRSLRWRMAVPLLRALSLIMGGFSRPWLVAFGQALGLLAYLCLPTARRRTLDHLAAAFPELDASALRRCARRTFQNLAIVTLEALVLHRWSREEILECLVNPEEFLSLIEETRSVPGAVLVSGHLGHWELLAAAYARLGGRLRVVGRRVEEDRADALLTALRGASGVTVLHSDDSPKGLLAALREGISVGILPDQDVTELDGVFVDFFGLQAYTPTAPAKLAIAARVATYLVYLVREGFHYRLLKEGPIFPEASRGPDAREAETMRLTRRWSGYLEAAIRRYPDQWVWMHQRWRNTPDRVARRRGAKRPGQGMTASSAGS
ncbi:MAG: hypothetical protein V1918_02340 [Planctomycetota bacterium]